MADADEPVGTLADELDAALAVLSGLAVDLVERAERDERDGAELSPTTQAGLRVGTAVIILAVAADLDLQGKGGRRDRLKLLLTRMAAWSRKNIEPYTEGDPC